VSKETRFILCLQRFSLCLLEKKRGTRNNVQIQKYKEQRKNSKKYKEQRKNSDRWVKNRIKTDGEHPEYGTANPVNHNRIKRKRKIIQIDTIEYKLKTKRCLN